MSRQRENFYVHLGLPFGVYVAAGFLVPAAMGWPDTAYIFDWLFRYSLFVGIAFLMCTVSVREDSIVLNRIFRMRWNEVASVEVRTFFGLPYVLARRKNGLPWWIPLYLHHLDAFKAALRAKAPAGTPFHAFAASADDL